MQGVEQGGVQGVERGGVQGVERGGHAGPPLQEIVEWFKTMTTNEYIRNVKSGLYPPFNKRMWQRNYYERIIRDKEEYQRVWQYIDKNPTRWEEDKYHLKHDFEDKYQ